jgi:hypothetical protein
VGEICDWGVIRTKQLEKEKEQLARDVDYWKSEVQRALGWQRECEVEKQRRNELKVRHSKAHRIDERHS